MPYQLEGGSERPLYRQLSDQIIRRILRGELRPGSRLPSTRSLAASLKLNRNTVVAAYADIVDQGYLAGRGGSGMFVREQLPQLPTRDGGFQPSRLSATADFAFAPSTIAPYQPVSNDLLRFTEGSPDVRLSDLRPLYATAGKLLGLPSGKTLLRYGDGRGDGRLREVLAALLGSSRGIVSHPDRLLVTRGSQHAFELACRVLFRGGGLLAVAELSYQPVLEIARASGAELLAIPLDEHGLDVEALRQHPRIGEIRALYLTPHHQYPTTVTLPPKRRLEVLELARRHGFAILEDDYDYDFHYDRPPRLPLAALDEGSGHVVYIGSFTKMLAPNLRVGFMHAPPDFLAAALELRLLADRQGDLLLERALAHFIRDGELERHLRRNRAVYRARREALIELLRERLGDVVEFNIPSGGMALWVRWRVPIDFDVLRARCVERGVWLARVPGAWRARRGLRLGFASLNETELCRAVDALAGAAKVESLGGT